MPQDKLCPLLDRPCIEQACVWWTRVQGNSPQTGQPVDHDACAIAWLPMLLCQNSQQSRQTGAEVSALRADLQTQHQAAVDVLSERAKLRRADPGRVVSANDRAAGLLG